MFSNPIHWRLRARRYRLTGALCAECGEPLFPPRLLCLDCVERKQEAPDVFLEPCGLPELWEQDCVVIDTRGRHFIVR